MAFANCLNSYIKKMELILRENGLDDKFDVNTFKNMDFANKFNFFVEKMKAILRKNGLDDKFDDNLFKNKIYKYKNNIPYITMNEDIVSLINRLSSNNTQVISSEELNKYPKLSCSKNGTGDRWANKKFNYTSIYGNKKANKTYSENESDNKYNETIELFKKNNINNSTKIIGIFVHSERLNRITRPINKSIRAKIICKACVSCGSHNDIICDHKNDIYNNNRVLNVKHNWIVIFNHYVIGVI